jgi:hypothetical protein
VTSANAPSKGVLTRRAVRREDGPFTPA